MTQSNLLRSIVPKSIGAAKCAQVTYQHYSPFSVLACPVPQYCAPESIKPHRGSEAQGRSRCHSNPRNNARLCSEQDGINIPPDDSEAVASSILAACRHVSGTWLEQRQLPVSTMSSCWPAWTVLSWEGWAQCLQSQRGQAPLVNPWGLHLIEPWRGRQGEMRGRCP